MKSSDISFWLGGSPFWKMLVVIRRALGSSVPLADSLTKLYQMVGGFLREFVLLREAAKKKKFLH